MDSNPFIYDKPLKCINTLCIKREKLLKEILRKIIRGSYYSILAPKYSGKTILLHQIMQEIKERNYPRVLSVYIDLADFRSLDLDSLFRQIYKRIVTCMNFKEEDAFTEFNNSISRLLQHLPDKKIILILDNIELIPDYLSKELIKTFRAIFMEREVREDFKRFIVIIAGAIGLFELSVGEGEGSPFNIAKCIILPEFEPQESKLLIEQGMRKINVVINEDAQEMLIKKTNGQPYLLQRLCYLTIEKIRQENRNTITTKDIKETIEDYIKIGIKDKVFKSMVKKIEEYSELLETLVEIMEGKRPKLREVGIEIGRLELSGAVIVNDDKYFLRNEIYERFLKNYFNYTRLGEFFTIAGRYDKAIDYFERLVKERNKLSSNQINNVFLSVFNLMFTSFDPEKIYDLILKGLYTFLGFDDVQIWILNKEEKCLECKRMVKERIKGSKIPISKEERKCFELKVFKEGKIIIEEKLSNLTYGIPLISCQGQPLGIIVAIRLAQDEKKGIKGVELDLLKSFALQAAIAIENAKRFKEIQDMEKSLIQLEKMSDVGLFAGGIAHEIINPLYNIKNALKFIETKIKTNELDKYIKIANENVIRASKIINDLLYFSKSSTLEMTNIDLNYLIKLTLGLVEKQIKDGNIEVDKKGLNPQLPKITANENELKLVVINLIKNAIQSMPTGGRINISTQWSDGRVQFSVSDTGTGISEEDKEKIFSPYFSTKPDGRGFGLALVRKIIEKHQGEIEVKSRLKEGTTFVVSLPIERRD